MASEVSSFKVVIVGEAGVGKSSIISSILGGESEITTGVYIVWEVFFSVEFLDSYFVEINCR